MLTFPEFLEFARTLRDEPVLSVYISGTFHDPATKDAWRVQLDRALTTTRKGIVEETPDTQSRFARCIEHFESGMLATHDIHAAPGWAIFVTERGVQRMDALPIDVPTSVAWTTGLQVTLYLRAIEEDHMGVIAMTDAHRVTLYKYQHNAVTLLSTRQVDLQLDEPVHMGNPPRQGFHPGTRGEAGREATQRALNAETDRMLRDVVEEIVRHVRDAGWVLIGGIPEVGHRLARVLPADVQGRTLQLHTLDINTSPAAVYDAARRGISALKNAATARRALQLLDASSPYGRATFDATEILHALGQSRVHELYVTTHYLDTMPTIAEAALRMALDHRTAVHVISGSAGRALDERGGVVARLRYASASVAPTVPRDQTIQA